MLLKNYMLKLMRPECNPSAVTLNALAELSDDITEVIPYINAIVTGGSYNPNANTLRFIKDGKVVSLHPRQIAVAKLKDETEARTVLESIKAFINDTYYRRAELEPSYKKGFEVTALDVFKLLPRTNCKQCGELTCLAFATKLVMYETTIAQCTPLFTGEFDEKKEELLEILAAAGYEITIM